MNLVEDTSQSPAGGAGWWGTASAGLGTIGDIYTAYQNMQARDQQAKLYGIQSDPAKMAGYIGKLYQPMTADVADAVRRQMIAPNWAATTGGATGGALTQFIADALAKIEAQRYGQAQQTALGALGGAQSNIPGQQGGFNLQGIMKNLSILRQIGGQQQPGLTDFATTPAYQDYRAGERAPVYEAPMTYDAGGAQGAF